MCSRAEIAAAVVHPVSIDVVYLESRIDRQNHLVERDFLFTDVPHRVAMSLAPPVWINEMPVAEINNRFSTSSDRHRPASDSFDGNRMPGDREILVTLRKMLERASVAIESLEMQIAQPFGFVLPSASRHVAKSG